uniref:Uncharacterized protein n=1 Tax=Rhizophora mucronata TaxID=61149 RepID=A0A2P2JJC3_RHIMU
MFQVHRFKPSYVFDNFPVIKRREFR